MRLSRLIFDEGFFALFCVACRPEEKEWIRAEWSVPAAAEASSEDTQVLLEELESEVESLIILKIICWIAAVRMCGRGVTDQSGKKKKENKTRTSGEEIDKPRKKSK